MMRIIRHKWSVSYIFGMCFLLGSSVVCADWKITNEYVGEFASWATGSKVEILKGDFDGNGTTDIALINRGGGWNTMPIAFSNKDGSWKITNKEIGEFASWATESKVEVLTGDFDCNGATDVALLNRAPGWNTMPVAYSDKRGGWIITNKEIGDFASWATGPSVKILTGNFTGRKVNSIVNNINYGECTDIALLNQAHGWNTMPVAYLDSNLTNWIIKNKQIGDFFAAWATDPKVRPLTGDFNNDGRTDVILIKTGQATGNLFNDNVMPMALSMGHGLWNISNNDGSAFRGTVRSPYEYDFFTGDFDGDGNIDIARKRMPSAPSQDYLMVVALNKREAGWPVKEDNSDWWAFTDIKYITGNFDDNESTTEIALLRRVPGWNTMPVLSFTSNGGWEHTNCSIGRDFSSWATGKYIVPLMGDFDGDGRTDIALLNKEVGWNTIPVAFSRAETQNCMPVTKEANNKDQKYKQCLQACSAERDVCMKEVATAEGPHPQQCIKELNLCNTTCLGKEVE